jgi:MbtH protein
VSEESSQYAVLVNDAEQYALHPTESAPPDGWHAAGFTGGEDACIRYVDEHWTDIRPRHIRESEDG